MVSGTEKITAELEQVNLNQEQVITPWDVHGEVKDGANLGINYSKLIDKFGCQHLTTDLIERFERLTGKRAHLLLRRGIFFSHRDFSRVLDFYEQKKPIYLYTGRGPSSDSIHLGHMIPFVLYKYLQDVLDCNLVIQMTDDEKFLFKDLTLEETKKFAVDNAKDIIAVGFNPEKTFIFMNTEYYGVMFDLVLKIQKCVTFNQASSIFGFSTSDSIGKVAFPAAEIAPAFPAAFPHLFGGRKDIFCLIPAAIYQDPYFRLARDVASRLGFEKPGSIYAMFFHALQGFNSKMSASAENTAIFMTDSPAQIKSKINKHAFSGGRDTLEEHRIHGGNPDIDVSFQYLKFFMDDDVELDSLANAYRKGELLSGDLKKRCIEVLQKFIQDFQDSRAKVDETLYSSFTTIKNKN